MGVSCVSAEIGGYMGLCLGASILTVCEFFEFIFDYCAKRRNNHRSRNMTKVTDVELGYKKDAVYTNHT